MDCDERCPLQEEKEIRTWGGLVGAEFSPASPHQPVLSTYTVVLDFLVIHGKA